MAWVLVQSSVRRSGNRYLVALDRSSYFAISVNGARPTSFHRTEDGALTWVSQREVDAASMRGIDVVGTSSFLFVNERGDRRVIECGRRRGQRERGSSVLI